MANFETIAFLILVSGFLIRALYVLVAPYDISKHDLGVFAFTGSNQIENGHLGYISYLYHFKHLPDFDPRLKGAFYNPPGFHMISALWYGLNQFLGFSEIISLESIQVLTLAFSTGIVIAGYKILLEIFNKNKILLFLLSFLSFFPFFTILGSTLNNDCLATLCSMIAILYTIRWYRNQNMKNIIIIAVSIGFGMLTKLSVGLLAFGIGFIFVYAFIKNIREYKRYLLQFSLFGFICVPLGLYWPIRNYLLYHMPFTYVPRVNSEIQFVGDYGAISRVGIPGLKQICYSFIRFNAPTEHNIWVQMVRTSLFDEIMPRDTVSLVYSMALFLFWITLLLSIIALVMYIRVLNSNKTLKIEMKLFFSILFTTLLFSFIQFSFLYPHICTMNFRYIVPIVLLPCLAWGSYLNEVKEDALSNRILTSFLYCFIGLSVLMNAAFIVWAPFKY